MDTPEVTTEENIDFDKYDYDGETDSGPSIQEEHAEVEAPAETPEPVKAAPVVEAKPAPVVPETKVEQLFEFTHNGKQIKAPLSQLIKWGQQGYDYAQKMAEFKPKQEAIAQLESTYKPIDEWVKQNPEKWEKLQAVIKAEKEGYGDLPPDHPLLQKLNQFETIANEWKSEREQARTKLEDEKLDQEVKSIQEKYKDLDWASVDDSGRTREQRVYAHAVENNIPTFKAAFFDLYHEDLLTAAETRAKEQFAASKEKSAKTGLLSTQVKAPITLKTPTNKSKHYESTETILAELGL